MKPNSLFIWGMLLLAVGGLGCRSKEQRNPSQTAVALVDTAGREVRPVSPIDRTGLQKLFRERNGKILFLNIWATWCAPCVEEFPDLVELARSYSEREVEVVGISADYPDEVETKIVPFLRKQKVPFEVFVAKFEHQEDFINGIDSSWSGALPATLIINQKGNRRFFLVGQGTFEKFRKAIDSVRSGP